MIVRAFIDDDATLVSLAFSNEKTRYLGDPVDVPDELVQRFRQIRDAYWDMQLELAEYLVANGIEWAIDADAYQANLMR